MFSKYFKSKKERTSKKDKEISLVVENPPQPPFVAQVPRSLLIKHSQVFSKMVEHGEFKKSRELKLKGITATGLQKMIEYLGTDSVFFQNHLEVLDTLKAAYVYQVTAVNEVCCNFLITALDPSNVCDIYEFAVSYSLEQVEYHCLRLIDRRAAEVLKSPAFLNLKRTTVCDLIRRNTLDLPSEVAAFRAVLTWGLNDCVRSGADPDRTEEVLKSAKPPLKHVRFGAMSGEEIASDPEVERFHRALFPAENSGAKQRASYLRSESVLNRSGSLDFINQQVSREYVPSYIYELEMLGSDEHSVRNGENFCLRIEVLKGRVFLTGVTLAFDRFVGSKGNSCLYVALSATNVKTTEQVTARGTFMISSDEAEVKWPCPLVAKETDSVELALHVKRAINICSSLIKGDSQIAVGERKDVVLKIIPDSASGGTERSMFKGIKYFY